MFATPVIAVILFAAGIINVEAELALVGLGTGSQHRHRHRLHTPKEIKNVLNLLGTLETEIRASEEKEQKEYDDFACECKKRGFDLSEELSDLKGKLPGMEADIKKGNELMEMLKRMVGDDKKDILSDQAAIDAAKGLHDKETKTFLQQVKDYETNIRALNKAIPALEKGIDQSSFLQTDEASVINKLALSRDMKEEDRDMLTAFLHQDDEAGYDPQSGQIVGILKQMRDEMKADLRKLKIDEAYNTASFNELIEARQKREEEKKAEMNAYYARLAEEAMRLAEEQAEHKDMELAVDRDMWSLDQWEKECYKRKKERKDMAQERADQLVAIAEAIKLLSSDETREMFKAVYEKKEDGDVSIMPVPNPEEEPAPAPPEFLQVQLTQKYRRARALDMLRAGRREAGEHGDSRLEFLEMALRGKKVNMDRIVQNIEELMEQLAKDAQSDLDKKEWCTSEFAEVNKRIKNSNIIIKKNGQIAREKQQRIDELTATIEKNEQAIEKDNETYVELTDKRKIENLHYLAKTSSNHAAIKVLKMAQNHLNKVFDPEKYLKAVSIDGKKEERFEVQEDGGAAAGASFLQTNAEHRHRHRHPATHIDFELQKLVTDLEKEQTMLKAAEEGAQQAYVDWVDDTDARRDRLQREIDAAASNMAQENIKLANLKSKITGAKTARETDMQIKGDLHGNCDFLLKYYKVRFNARRIEIQSLKNAKLVLEGTDIEDIHAGDRETSVFKPGQE